MKGIVTVYSAVGCPHCLQAKKTLEENNVQFKEVFVDKFPHIREWLREKTGKSGVPQIFFNEILLGDNATLQATIKDEDKWKKLIHELENNPSKDELLIATSEEALHESKEFCNKEEPFGPVVEEFSKSSIPRPIRVKWFTSKSEKTFSGKDFVEWHIQTKSSNRKTALDIGSELLGKRFFLPASNEVPFEQMVDSDKIFYKLNETDDSHVLNGGKVQNLMIGSASEFAERLKEMMAELYADHLSEDGKLVDYDKMKNSDKFSLCKELSKGLQRVAVESLDEVERKAFFINVYNALVIHANAEMGFPSGIIALSKFYSQTKYIIGGHVCSLDDIEHGILRANSRPVTNFFPLFSRDDPRKKLSLSMVDPRIHFALNCGAKSCPPIRSFSAKNLDEELNIATNSYLESDEGVQMDYKPNQTSTVHLSSLLKWYSADFGGSHKNVLAWVALNVGDPDKAETLNKIVEENSFKVVYLDYNWDKNAL